MEWTQDSCGHIASGLLGRYRVQSDACAINGPTGTFSMHMQLHGDKSGLRVIRFGTGTIRSLKAKAEKHDASAKPLKWSKTFDHYETSAKSGIYHIDECDPGLGRRRFMLRWFPAGSASGSWERLGSGSDIKSLQRQAQHHALKNADK